MLEDALRAAKLQRAKTVASNLYSFLIQQGEEAKIRASAKNGGLLVVSPPLLPQKPMPQNKGRNIFIGIILGFGLGFGIAFVYDIMDKSICSPDDLKKHTGLDVVGVIPKVDNVQKKQSKSSRGKGGKNTGFDALSSNGASARSYLLLPRLSTKHPMVEAFRNLRMDLQFVNVDEPLKNLIISSSTPYEGKTQTTVKLAISYAELDMNVLIVDCDLRKPKQHQVFEVQRSPGLTDYLARDIPLEDIIKATSFVNVQVLPAGTTPPNPTEMLGSNKMKNLLTLVDDMYDFVLFDTPPIIAVSDAKMLAQRVKNVLLVVRAAKTNYQVITEAKARLEKVEAYIVGAVLNGVEMRKGYGYNYQYNYYYEDYYSSGSKKKRSKSKRKVKA